VPHRVINARQRVSPRDAVIVLAALLIGAVCAAAIVQFVDLPTWQRLCVVVSVALVAIAASPSIWRTRTSPRKQQPAPVVLSAQRVAEAGSAPLRAAGVPAPEAAPGSAAGAGAATALCDILKDNARVGDHFKTELLIRLTSPAAAQRLDVEIVGASIFHLVVLDATAPPGSAGAFAGSGVRWSVKRRRAFWSVPAPLAGAYRVTVSSHKREALVVSMRLLPSP
jgi:hypothetical protein